MFRDCQGIPCFFDENRPKNIIFEATLVDKRKGYRRTSERSQKGSKLVSPADPIQLSRACQRSTPRRARRVCWLIEFIVRILIEYIWLVWREDLQTVIARGQTIIAVNFNESECKNMKEALTLKYLDCTFLLLFLFGVQRSYSDDSCCVVD